MKLQHFDGWWRSIDPRPAIVEEQIGSVWSCLLCSGPLRPCTRSMRLAATAPWCCLGPVSGFCNVVRALTQFYNQNVSQTSGWRSWKYDFLVPLAIQILKTFRNHTRSSGASDIQFRSRSFYGGFSLTKHGLTKVSILSLQRDMQKLLATFNIYGKLNRRKAEKRCRWICSQHAEMDWYTFCTIHDVMISWPSIVTVYCIECLFGTPFSFFDLAPADHSCTGWCASIECPALDRERPYLSLLHMPFG